MKAPKLGVQSKFNWFLKLYISGSTNSKVGNLQVETLLGILFEKTKFSISKQVVNP